MTPRLSAWSGLQPATRTLVPASARVLKHPLQAKACSTTLRKFAALGMSWLCLASSIHAQQPLPEPASIDPVRPQTNILRRPYTAPDVPPVRLADTPRLDDLIRAGNLYLTVQDAIALAIENNLDIEV